MNILYLVKYFEEKFSNIRLHNDEEAIKCE